MVRHRVSHLRAALSSNAPVALAISFGLAVSVAPSSLSAQPSASELRAEIERLRRDRPAGIRASTLTAIAYLVDVAERIERSFPTQSLAWRGRAARFLETVRAGRDPYPEQRGRIVARGYRSPISETLQGYAIYIPPDYDPSRRYPLLVMLHGGSSNGNLFLGVVLGNNMDWETYSQHLWDEYTPRWFPNWIVVAPDGFGQVLWRWMGEQDVLDVIADVQRHYSVDPDRIVLGGLSNGGLGAYTIGMRHAWRFSLVMAIAGAPSWVQYAGGAPTDEERILLETHSGLHLVESSVNTDFRFFHGRRDPGPMRPAYVTEMEAHMRSLGLTPQVRWYDFGHDLLYLVHRHGRAYDEWARVVRNLRPREVRVVSGDYRASRQHWVTITRIDDYPRLARVRAIADEGAIAIETSRVLEFALDLRDAPIGQGEEVRITVDGAEAYRGPRAPLGHVIHLHREGGQAEGPWRLGFLPPPPSGFEKRPGLSGPLTDAYRDRMVHVYGTGDPQQTAALRAAAERGARGWPLWLWNFQQRVVADTEVTEELMRRAHLVLYGTPGSNSILERIAAELPIRVSSEGVQVGSRMFRGDGVGTRFIYPNPLAPTRYVIVQAAPTVAGVQGGHNLPDFLPDWVVYDARTTRSRPRLISGRNGQLAMGFFDRFWRLPDSGATAHDRELHRPSRETDASEARAADEPAPCEGEEERWQPTELAVRRGFRVAVPQLRRVLEQDPPPQLAPGEAPEEPPPPRCFRAPRSDPAGRIARLLARLVPTFVNYRAMIPGGQWRVDHRAVWQIRSQRECYSALAEANMPATPIDPLPTPVPSPVRITGPIGGVRFRMSRPADGPLTVSCEMALRLPVLAEVVRRHGVRAITIASAYRTKPWQSFHRFGLALDMSAFELDDGTVLHVSHDFVETPAHRTCEAPEPPTPAARTLLAIACELVDTLHFSSVLTPNYNEGHRDHFHIDARPDDPRIFVR